MAKTIKQKKAEIHCWRAKYDGWCPRCSSAIRKGDLVARSKSHDVVIHYICHPDWVPTPFPGYDYSGRKIKDDERA